MRRPFLVALAVSFAALTGLPANAQGVVVHIGIEDFDYLPRTKTVNVSTDIHFAWDNAGSFTHTATSNGGTGFIGTGDISPAATGEAYLYGSGTYRYHCYYHPSLMNGVVKVRPTTSDASFALGGSATITYGNAFSKGTSWDLQRRRNGGAWVNVRVDTLDPDIVFSPTRRGTFDLRARTHNFVDETSGWSPIRTLKVT
jgi:plastocyanin